MNVTFEALEVIISFASLVIAIISVVIAIVFANKKD